jgi:hypothetical protein
MAILFGIGSVGMETGELPPNLSPNGERGMSSLPREQLETRHGAPDIRVFERVWVTFFHACDLVDSAVRFKHIDDQAIVCALVD